MWDGVCVECEIEEVCHVLYCDWSEVFQVFDVYFVWTLGVVVAASFYGFLYMLCCDLDVCGGFVVKVTVDFSVLFVCGVGD